MTTFAGRGPSGGRYGHQVHEALIPGTPIGAGNTVWVLFEGGDLELPVWLGLVG